MTKIGQAYLRVTGSTIKGVASSLPFTRKKRTVLPGYPLTLGLSLFYLSLFIFLPFCALGVAASRYSLEELWQAGTDPRSLAAYRLTFLSAFLAALFNLFAGGLVAWVLSRYSFPGRRLMDALIDLPFALPTAVAGITLASLYGPNGLLGKLFASLGVQVAFTPLGVGVALVFIGFPFVVRAVQPVLEDLDPELEEAALSLGATPWQTFTKVILPELFPSLLSGFTMALARGLGEYGSVIFIAGNLPYRTEISSLLIAIRLEEYDYAGAIAIALVMLLASFFLLYLIYRIGSYPARRYGYTP